MKLHLLTALSVGLFAQIPAFAADAATAAAPASLIANGDFQKDENADGAPDGWSQPKGTISYGVEGENKFVRITSEKPGQLALLYRPVNIPAGTKALELTWKQRLTNLKPGAQSWFDARIMMNWKDAAGAKMKGSPSAPYARKNTDGWQERSVKFLVPEGATLLEFMPCLFQVESGTYDLDDLVLVPTDPAPIEEAARAKAAGN